MDGQEPDVYFYGDVIEKIGEDTYRITHGGFTTCVQPTPRWQITSGSATLRVDHYAFLKNALVKAKGVPVFYLPALFYPIQKDDRATGFLMPTYGTSTYRRQDVQRGVLLGDQPEPGRDVPLRPLLEARPGHGRRGPGTPRRRDRPGTCLGVPAWPSGRSTTARMRTARRRWRRRPPGATRSARTSTSRRCRGWSARGRIDYFTEHQDAAGLQHQTSSTSSRSTRTYGGSLSGRVSAGLSGERQATTASRTTSGERPGRSRAARRL